MVARSLAVKPAPDELASRVDRVFGWIVQGATEQQIQTLAAKEWPGGSAQPLIVGAMKRIAEMGDSNPQVMQGWCLEACRAIYRKAMTAQTPDYELALKCVQQIHRIARS